MGTLRFGRNARLPLGLQRINSLKALSHQDKTYKARCLPLAMGFGLSKAKAEKTPHLAPETYCPLVVYDGVCVFCNRSVRWILRRRNGHKFHFMAWQSPQRPAYISHTKPLDAPDSLWLLDTNGKGYTGSEAALRIALLLGFPWNLLGAPAYLFSSNFRQRIYQSIAQRRYRWFGKHQHCPLPDAQKRAKFVL